MTIVLVTGGRHYNDRKRVYDVLDDLHARVGITEIWHGACPVGTGGADILAEDWAKSREIDYRGFPAKFSTEGPSGGPQRNGRMVRMLQLRPIVRAGGEEKGIVVAFPGGRGTANCVKYAKQWGFEPEVIE